VSANRGREQEPESRRPTCRGPSKKFSWQLKVAKEEKDKILTIQSEIQDLIRKYHKKRLPESDPTALSLYYTKSFIYTKEASKLISKL
jgi:hypothetical protein